MEHNNTETAAAEPETVPPTLAEATTILRSVAHDIPVRRVSMNLVVVAAGRGRKDFGDIMDLANQIKDVGLINPPTVTERDGKFYLNAGERRYRACVLLGWTELPVHVKNQLTTLEQKKIELIENIGRKQLDWPEEVLIREQIHNAQVALHGHGGKGLTGGWTQEKSAQLMNCSQQLIGRQLSMAKMLRERPELRARLEKNPFDIALKIANQVTKTEALHADHKAGKIKTSQSILEGDANQLIKQLATASIDLILTDPPFGLPGVEDSAGTARGSSISYTALIGSSDNLSPDAAKQLLTPLLAEWYRVLKPSSHIYVFCSFELYTWLLPRMMAAGFEFGSTDMSPLIWDKEKSTAPFTGLSYAPCYEVILFCHKPPRKRNLADPKSKNILRYPPLHSSKKIHRFQKPNDLIAFLITNSTNLGDTVLDTFVGSGVVVRMCQELNRTGIGFESDHDNWARAQNFLITGVLG